MVFSSIIFLFLFLPVVLTAYYAVPRQLRNLLLLGASLFFYAWGELGYVLLMLASIMGNYLLGLLLDRSGTDRRRKAAFVSAVVLNLALLGSFKYANFLVDNFNVMLGWLGFGAIELAPVHLPIGISFFTFQALSYIVDVYRGESAVQRSPVKLALFISLFPQLIAGPIVRYDQIAAQLTKRAHDATRIHRGVRRFIIGLAKKVLIANTVAIPADRIFAADPSMLTPGVAWLGVACYTLQIYFDFSGYSDMAVGLGNMFGFDFPENFRYPYVSRSVREFWRRWHISLSTWFRDYLYIPLGGGRVTTRRVYANLVLVFFLCGLWHGASWSFVVWGLFHGVFLVIERTAAGRMLERLWRPIQHGYVIAVFIVGWVFFRATTLDRGLDMLGAMVGLAPAGTVKLELGLLATPAVLITLAVGVIASTPIVQFVRERLTAMSWRPWHTLAGSGALDAALLALFILCAMPLASGTHNPFIYFRF